MRDEPRELGMGSDDIASDAKVRLRPLTADDLECHAHGCDDEVNKWTNEGRLSSLDQHLAWLERNAAAWRHREPVVDLAIERCDTGEHVGVVGVQRGLAYLLPGEVNLTFALYAGQRGRGFVTAAVNLAMRVALEQGSVTSFIIRCSPDNHRSAAVAQRTGFSYVGFTQEESEALDRYVLRPGPQAG